MLLDAAPYCASHRDLHLQQLVQAAGLEASLLPLRPTQLAQVHDGALVRLTPGSPRSVPGVGWRDAWRIRRLARLERGFEPNLDPDVPEKGTRLDDRSAADFVRLYFGPRALAGWAEPLARAEWLGDVEETRPVLTLPVGG